VGPFLAIYLAGYKWDEERVGLALTVGGIAGILTQTPAGALVDWARSKRALVGVGVAMLAAGALLIALFPSFWPVMGAQVLIGSTAVGIGAALSQVIAGSIVHRVGSTAGFLFLAGVAAAAFAILYFFMPETRSTRAEEE
jgi:predicted MFS family arabinose efflux permease